MANVASRRRILASSILLCTCCYVDAVTRSTFLRPRLSAESNDSTANGSFPGPANVTQNLVAVHPGNEGNGTAEASRSNFSFAKMVNGSLQFHAMHLLKWKQPDYGCSAKCGDTMDMAFIVDVSASVDNNAVMALKLFLARLTTRLNLGMGPGQQLVGGVEALETPRVLTLLTPDLKVWEDAINSIKVYGGGALHMSPALGYSESILMQTGRAEAGSQIIAIVDGPALHQRGVLEMAERVSGVADLIVILVAPPEDGVAIQAATEWLQAAGSCMHSPSCRFVQVPTYQALAESDLTGVLAEMCQSLV